MMLRCYTMSNILILILLVADHASNTIESDYLGASPNVIEWSIAVWFLGKFVEEIVEIKQKGFFGYKREEMNYVDLVLLMGFSALVIARIVDFKENQGNPSKICFHDWPPIAARVVATSLMACIYIIAFSRILEFAKSNRILGPLSVILSKMIVVVLKFLALYFVLWFAFSLGLAEVFWRYYSDQSMNCSTQKNRTDTYENFRHLSKSMTTLFWLIFDHYDPAQLRIDHIQHFLLHATGSVFLVVYHIIMILILINMLIATMTESFQVLSQHERTERKYHRVLMWIRLIEKKFFLPTPVNLVSIPIYYMFVRNQRCFIGQRQLKKEEYEVGQERKGEELEEKEKAEQEMQGVFNSNTLVKRYILSKFVSKQKSTTKCQ